MEKRYAWIAAVGAVLLISYAVLASRSVIAEPDRGMPASREVWMQRHWERMQWMQGEDSGGFPAMHGSCAQAMGNLTDEEWEGMEESMERMHERMHGTGRGFGMMHGPGMMGGMMD